MQELSLPIPTPLWQMTAPLKGNSLLDKPIYARIPVMDDAICSDAKPPLSRRFLLPRFLRCLVSYRSCSFERTGRKRDDIGIVSPQLDRIDPLLPFPIVCMLCSCTGTRKRLRRECATGTHHVFGRKWTPRTRIESGVTHR